MTKNSPFSNDVDPVAAEVLLDVLLLSIIKAHPVSRQDASTDQQRLNIAKKAIFGIKTPPGRAPASDLPELTYMARRYIAERQDPATRLSAGKDVIWDRDWIPTFPESPDRKYSGSYTLAAEALEWSHKSAFESEEDEPELEKDEQFFERAHSLQKKFDRLKDPMLRMVYGRDGLGESVFLSHLHEIKGLLESLGLSTIDPLEPIRDAKYPI